jgi:hypothetical protein
VAASAAGDSRGMSLLGARRAHPAAPSGDRPVAPIPARSGSAAGCAPPIDAAERACCCLGHPVARVVLPSGGDRPGQEIFLCAHHLRGCAARLRALDIHVYDDAGLPIARPETFFTSAH